MIYKRGVFFIYPIWGEGGGDNVKPKQFLEINSKAMGETKLNLVEKLHLYKKVT